MATKEVKLGRDYRLYIASTESPTDDTGFTLIENESNLTYKWSNDVQEFQTKLNGVISTPGAQKYEISGEFGQTHQDAGMTLFHANKGSEWKYQIRYKDLVVLEGTFIGTEAEVGGEAVGVSAGSFTLVSSGVVTENLAGRELTPAA